MNKAIVDLLSIAGPSVCLHGEGELARHNLRGVSEDLQELLAAKNGFYAFDSSLLVRPLQNATAPFGLLEWNNRSLWKYEFDEPYEDFTFFAEDIFGVQYCVQQSDIYVFDPETGIFEILCNSIGDWANIIIQDVNFRTGALIAKEWQNKYGKIQPGSRLLPKKPFVLGGGYEIENLYLCNELEGMRFRACIAKQIRDLPDGSEVIVDATRK